MVERGGSEWYGLDGPPSIDFLLRELARFFREAGVFVAGLVIVIPGAQSVI